MNGKKHDLHSVLPLILLTLVAGAVGVAGYRQGDRPPSSARSFMANSAGAVLFEHDLHIERTDGCESCHHPLLSSDSRTACSECHGEDVVAEDFEHEDLKAVEAHTCTTCHRQLPEVEPVSCRSCHPAVQGEETEAPTCLSCHSEDDTPDLLTHDEMQEIDGHECGGCHHVRPINVVYHEQCSGCHAVEDSARFLDEEGRPKCNTCHLK